MRKCSPDARSYNNSGLCRPHALPTSLYRGSKVWSGLDPFTLAQALGFRSDQIESWNDEGGFGNPGSFAVSKQP